MTGKTGHIIILIIIIVLAHVGQDIYAQGTDMGLVRKPGAFFGITAGPLKSNLIINEGTLDTESGSNSGRSFYGNLEAGYLISKYFGFKSGIGYTSYSAEISLYSYQDALMNRDSENESYELRITASNINESQSLKTMIIPLNIIINIPLGGIASIFVEPGMNLVIPVMKNYSNSGFFTYKGYYQEYNVLLENLPLHDFSSNRLVNAEGDPELKQTWLDATVYSGLNIVINPKLRLSGGFFYSRSVTDISGYKSRDEFHLSPSPGITNSLIGGADKVSTKATGFSITLRYFISR